MTVIVALRCAEGVVIGADSAVTLGTLGHQTVRQTYEKIEVVDGRALVAVSGPVGLAQRIVGEVQKGGAEKRFRGEPWEVMTVLRRSFAPHIEDELRAAQQAVPVIGPAAAQASALSHSIVAMPVRGEARLFQFDALGAPEEATAQLPFACVGSGQPLADPFMAFLRSIFWDEGKFPRLTDGIFATLWTVQQAIDVAPSGIAGPAQLFTLEREGSDWIAVKLADEELQEHYQAIDQAKKALRDFPRSLQVPSADVPPPPLPPEASPTG